MDFIIQIGNFFKELWNSIQVIDKWIWDLAYQIRGINPENTVSYPLGVFRYIVGDTVYTIFITTLYFSIIFVALKLIKFVLDWIKSFNPIT